MKILLEMAGMSDPLVIDATGICYREDDNNENPDRLGYFEITQEDDVDPAYIDIESVIKLELIEKDTK